MKKYQRIAGRKFAYIDQGEGPVLLFGHSYLWDSAMWAPQIAALSSQYRCIAPDLWGHGDSDGFVDEPYSLNQLACDHLALLDALGIDKFTLVGLSIGGMWGIELSQLVPERLQGLVLMDTFVGLEPQITHDRYLAMLNMIEQRKAIPAAIVDQVAPLFFRHQPDESIRAHFIQQLLSWPQDKIAALVAIGRSFVMRADRMSWLEALSIPTLVMTGCEDKARPVLEGYLMAQARRCRFIEIPAAGHIASLENPAFVSQMLQTFLTDLDK